MKTNSNIKHCESTYCSNFFTVGHKRRQKFCQRSCGKRMANDRWAMNNPEKVNASQRTYKRNRYNEDAEHREYRKQYNNTYWHSCDDTVKSKMQATRYDYQKDKQQNDVGFRIRMTLTSRIKEAVKNAKTEKCDKSVSLLGCSIEQVRTHLEKQFSEGMTWENHGEWHIDHIKPCVAFDLSKEEEQRECFHYSNLQPLWAKDNIRKGATWNTSSLST